MRLPARHALLSLALAVGVLGSLAPSAGAQTVPGEETSKMSTMRLGRAAVSQPAPAPSPAPAPQPAPAPAPTPAPPASTISVPARVSAPVIGAATITGTLSQPHAGVSVVAEQQLGGTWTRIGTATTRTDGSFTITTAGGDARLGTYTVRVSTADARVSTGTTPTVLVSRTFTDPHQQLTDAQVRAIFKNHGLTWWSSGNCTDRTRSNCTSFDQMRASTVTETITLQQKSGCALLVTGGTETGHATGTYSHWNGYKIDLQMSSCISSWVYQNGPSIGGSKWRVGTTIYYNERNHWDVQTRP